METMESYYQTFAFSNDVQALMTDSRFNTLFPAARFGHLDVVKELLKDPRVDPGAWFNHAIYEATTHGHHDVVWVLLADPRVNPQYALFPATRKGDLDVVKALLADPRVDPANDNNFAIIMAALLGHLDVVKELLADPRVDPAVWDNWAILRAAHQGHLDVVAALLTDPRVYWKISNSKNFLRYPILLHHVVYREFLLKQIPIPNDLQKVVKGFLILIQ